MGRERYICNATALTACGMWRAERAEAVHVELRRFLERQVCMWRAERAEAVSRALGLHVA